MSTMFKIIKFSMIGALALSLFAGAVLAGGGIIYAHAAAGHDAAVQTVNAPVAAKSAARSFDAAGPGEVTFDVGTPGLKFTPKNAYLANGGTTDIHATLPDGTVTTVDIAMLDSTKIELTKAVSVVYNDPLTVTMNGNTATITSKNGAPLGKVVVLTFTAKKDQGSLIFPYGNTKVAQLTGPTFTVFNNVTNSGAVERGAVCYNYQVSDPAATSATLTVMVNTGVTSAADNAGKKLSTSVSDTVLTVSSPMGIGLGRVATVCFTATADNAPFGVPALDPATAPIVVIVP